MYRKNTASQFFCFQGVDSTTGGIKSGVTWTIRRCIDGTFAAATGSTTEDGTTGWYKMALSQAYTNGNDISFNFTGTGAIPQTVNIITTACDPTTATNFGITGIPAVASGSAGALLVDGTGTAAISNSSGKVLLQAAQKVDVDTIKTNPVVNGGTITFPTNATLASTTNITAGTITTTTNLTNLPSIPANWLTATGIAAAALNGKGDWATTNPTNLTAAQIATGVWQDTTAGDFTTPASVGLSVMNGVSLGTGLTVAAVSGAVGSVTGAVGSVSGLTASNLDVTVSSRLASANITLSGGIVSADVKKMNATTVNGTGVSGDLWRG